MGLFTCFSDLHQKIHSHDTEKITLWVGWHLANRDWAGTHLHLPGVKVHGQKSTDCVTGIQYDTPKSRNERLCTPGHWKLTSFTWKSARRSSKNNLLNHIQTSFSASGLSFGGVHIAILVTPIVNLMYLRRLDDQGREICFEDEAQFPGHKAESSFNCLFLVPGWVEKNAYNIYIYTLVCWIHNGYILVVSIDKHIYYVFKTASFAIPFASFWASEGLTSSSELPLWSQEVFCHWCHWDVTHISKTLPQNLMIWCDLVT